MYQLSEDAFGRVAATSSSLTTPTFCAVMNQPGHRCPLVPTITAAALPQRASDYRAALLTPLDYIATT